MYNKPLLLLILIFFLTACSTMPESNKQIYASIRLPAVAGTFYPDSKSKLENDIKSYLDKAEAKDFNTQAIVVPHASYVYSAQVAAHAYKQINPDTKRVFLLANAHSAYFQGIALAGTEAWQTPLGLVPVDKDAIEQIDNEVAGTSISREAHQGDHTLEVQLPFLQNILKDFQIVPILFGVDTDYRSMAEWLNGQMVVGDLLVVSTDLSHYPAYDDANRIDMKTLDLIVSKNIEALDDHIDQTMKIKVPGEDTLACGETAIKVLMQLANSRDWQGQVLEYANSGDKLLGDKSRVVGYGAIAFGLTRNVERVTRNGAGELNFEQKDRLLQIARETVEAYVRSGERLDFKVEDERLDWKEGAFVTLHKEGKLRGCIGQIEPSLKPLWQVVRDMAIEAATDDPRFEPVSKEELDLLIYEVSVLSRPEKIDDWQDIELGKHGVIISKGLFNKGVFLPQVANETGWGLEEFLAHLAHDKAGLDPEAYKDSGVKLEVFTAQVVRE